MDHARGLVLFTHMLAGILWVGGLVYVRFVLHPGLGRQQPAVRGPMVADVGPRTVGYLLRMGELTIALGIVNVFMFGRVTVMEHFVSTVWGLSITLGFLFALAIYLIGQLVTRPTTARIAETVRAVAAGTPPPDAPALLEALAARQGKALLIQVALGVAAVLTMATARFS